MGDQFGTFPSFLEIGGWTRESIQPLFNFFKNEDVAPALAFVIFGASLLLCALFLFNVARIRIALKRRTRAIAKIPDQQNFTASMPIVDRFMLSSSYLRHAWQKFRETLIEPDEDHPLQVVRNAARPQLYFNVTEAGLRFAIFRAMPNLLVGVGLLLTFFGLVSALHFTTDAIKNATDLGASQDALKDLLHAASFKFYTSIAGLGGSIVLTLVLRYGTSRIEAGFDELSFALERKMVFVTSEYLAFEHLKETKEQTAGLKKFSTEIAVSIGRSIDEALSSGLPRHLADALAPIGKSLEDVASKLTSMNEGAIGDLAGKFVDRLDASTGEHMAGLARTLEELRSSLER
ncbi:hypothetical protein ABID59_007051 [Bradyrhizobium sp. S3.3.6]|uniref:anti-phage ZorAB system protein ZorA n=1 Tax=Bradyrhizobium sp. S3.3.6 TaxID=3156429 RepID=UPI0033981A22